MPELIPITLPTDQEEGTSAAVEVWLVKVGERVARHQPLLEVNTDKVSLEIAAPEEGVLEEILKREGEEISPGEVLGRLRPAAKEKSQRTAARAEAGSPKRAAGGAARPLESARTSAAPSSSGARLSPAVRRALKEHALNPAEIAGSGRGGRITFRDVQEHLQQGASETPSRSPIGKEGGSRRVPHTPMRLSIARHMVESQLRTAPHVTSVFEAGFHQVLKHYRKTRDSYQERGTRLTLTAYLVAAAAHALGEVPEINSRWHEDALEIFSDCNIGVATALEHAGLVVPVIRQAQDLNLFGIATQLQELTEKARGGRLKSSDLEGGTFTITNHGVSGSLIATPIINQPQNAILGVGKIEKRVQVDSGEDGDSILIRPMAYVTLTVDHRALDGFTANRFLSAFCERIENWGREP